MEWSAESAQYTWKKLFDNFFYNNIIKKNHIKFSKEWHKNIKMIRNYQSNKGILDTKKGPIADLQNFRKAMEGQIEWEDIRVYRQLK